MVGYEYAGIAYEKQGEMLAARRRHYVELVLAGMGYAEAARAVGVSKRTGKVWRNGRTRSTGRNEAPCAEWTEAAMPQPKPTGPRYLSMDERIFIADGLVCGLSMSAIASRLGRSRSTVCREVARNRDRGTGRYTPYRAGEMAAARRRRPSRASSRTEGSRRPSRPSSTSIGSPSRFPIGSRRNTPIMRA